MNTIKIYGLILIYNKNISESLTYNCLKNSQLINLLIIDNSTQEIENQNFADVNQLDYIKMSGNVGLSKAYNFGLNYLKGKYNYLILLDDDTNISYDYQRLLFENIKENPEIEIFVPKVYSAHNNKLYSPRVKSSIHAINSGLCIKENVFEKYRYDEKLFLYFVDLKFFNDQQNRKIKIFDGKITQNFSEFTIDYTQATYNQFALRIQDAKKYFPIYKYYPYLLIFVVAKFVQLKKIQLLKLFFI